jgi:hypothetical protein
MLVLEGQKDRKALTTIRKYFNLPSQMKSRDYNTQKGKLVPGTATWILQNVAFQKWSRFEKPVLSLQGSPGCGKSYLSTRIIQHLSEVRDMNILIWTLLLPYPGSATNAYGRLCNPLLNWRV